MPIVAKLDELGKPAWIALMILGFFIWWPLGLHYGERTNDFLERRYELVRSAPNASCRELVAAVAAAERQPRL